MTTWKRVHGPNIDKENKAKANKNEAVLKSQPFIKACEAAGITPTRRQAGKWNNGKGLAIKHKRKEEIK